MIMSKTYTPHKDIIGVNQFRRDELLSMREFSRELNEGGMLKKIEFLTDGKPTHMEVQGVEWYGEQYVVRKSFNDWIHKLEVTHMIRNSTQTTKKQ